MGVFNLFFGVLAEGLPGSIKVFRPPYNLEVL
jgi:hypothetical protein